MAPVPESDWRVCSRVAEIRGGVICCCDCCLTNDARDPLFGTGNEPEDSGRSKSYADVAGPGSGVCAAPVSFLGASSARRRREDVEESPIVICIEK